MTSGRIKIAQHHAGGRLVPRRPTAQLAVSAKTIIASSSRDSRAIVPHLYKEAILRA